jgi:hypothetical protein
MRMRALIGCWLAVASFAAAAAGWMVPQTLWERPRTASAVMAEPAIKQAVNSCLAQPSSQLVIHHAVGQEPLVQAEELRAWLMGLAVASNRIRLVNDLKPGEAILLELTQ